MPFELPDNLLLIAGGAFLGGWIVAKVGALLGRRFSAGDRDPRDDRIRSLSADVRVAQTAAEKTRAQLEETAKELTETQKIVKVRDDLIEGKESLIKRLKDDLKESVMKTRELRSELTERATEHVRSEVKLREVETELSVVQAGSDLLSTGVLDYTTTDEGDEVPVFKTGR
jgi:chromosome segregation ATPase